MYSLGIDIGSTFVKAAVFSVTDGATMSEKMYPCFKRIQSENPNEFEISADEIFNTVEEIILNVSKEYPLTGVFLATQMHGFIYSVKGKKDTYVSWQDSRSTDLLPSGKNSMEELSTLISKNILSTMGVPLKPSLGLCNLYALLKKQPSLAKNGTLYTLGSYLIHRLTGNNITHISNAAPLGIVNITEGCINPQIMTEIGLDHVRLPWLAPDDFYICGYYQANGQSIPIYPDYGDHQVSVLGSNVPENYGIINIATASQVGYISDNLTAGNFEVRPYFNGKYLNTISNMPGGRNLQVVANFIGECISLGTGEQLPTKEVWQLIDSRFQEEESSLKVNTLFYPTQERLSGGEFTNITPDNLSVNQLLTAAYTNMGEIYKKNLVEVCGGSLPEGVVFSGGVSWKNSNLIKIVGNILQINYRKSPQENEVFQGLKKLAMKSLEGQQ